MNKSMIKTICNGVAVAMGIAVIVTNVVSPLPLTGIASLLAIGLTAVGIAGLQK